MKHLGHPGIHSTYIANDLYISAQFPYGIYICSAATTQLGQVFIQEGTVLQKAVSTIRMKISGRPLVTSDALTPSLEYDTLIADEGLSFWGGIDPLTGRVIDASHPLHGDCVSGKILCIPSGRGSCTASQVLLELILHDIAPRAIVLRDVDPLVCVGALIAAQIFNERNIDIFAVGHKTFEALIREKPARISMDLPPAQKVIPTEQESQLLANAISPAEEMALNVIFQYARICGTSEYVPVSQAHIDGCTYIGPGGLAFARALVQQGGRVKVTTTLNSMSVDRLRWKDLQVPEEYATHAMALGDAYLELGCLKSFTCAPYLLSNAPQYGQDIAWGESNAVVYANSVIGARTEKYADYLDICAAITGVVPRTGVHDLANRVPKVHIDASDILEYLSNDLGDDRNALFPILGHVCGRLSDGKVPLVSGMEKLMDDVNQKGLQDNLKSFCAAFGTTASSPLVHIKGLTAEAQLATNSQWAQMLPARQVSKDDVLDTIGMLESSDNMDDEQIDLIALGNPHMSISECEELLRLVRSLSGDLEAQKNSNLRVIACMSRELYDAASDQGLVAPLKRFGVEFVADTCWCMLLDPPVIPTKPNAHIMTNSGKYAHYGPGLTGKKFRFGSTIDCARAAITGLAPQATSLRQRIGASLSQQKRLIHSSSRRFLSQLF